MKLLILLLGVSLTGCSTPGPPKPTVPAADAPIWHLNEDPADDSNAAPPGPVPADVH